MYCWNLKKPEPEQYPVSTETRMEIGDFAIRYADIASSRFQDSRVFFRPHIYRHILQEILV